MIGYQKTGSGSGAWGRWTADRFCFLNKKLV
jgi:hypothetical protein